MSIAVTTWDEIDQTNYDAARALFVEIVAEAHPEVETRGGTVSDMVLTLQGVLAAAGRIERQRLLESNSLLQATTNPLLADPNVLNDLFSNYYITRQFGTGAAGQITIELSQPTPVVIVQGFAFTCGTQTFTTVNSFAARLTQDSILSATDRLLTQQPDGTYTFIVDVQAASLGSAGNLTQGETFVPSKALPNFVQAYATTDYSGGSDLEDNAALVARAELGIAAKTWSNATNITALVRSQPGFASALVSVVGAGMPEMLRDKHSLFPLAYGNRVDVYVKTVVEPTVFTVTLPATYIGTGVNGPIWQILLSRTDIPAVYTVTKLGRVGRSPGTVVAPTHLATQYMPLSGDPDIAVPLETAFSCFQSLLVTFTDAADPADALTPNVTQVQYTVTGTALSGIDTLQAALSTPAVRSVAGDLVVRAAVPCFVSLDLDFDKINSQIPTTDIAAALATYVNTLPFGAALFASRVISIVSAHLPAGVNLQRVKLSGIVLGPDGSKKLYRTFEALMAPDKPQAMITSNTVAFYLDPTDITFNPIAATT